MQPGKSCKGRNGLTFGDARQRDTVRGGLGTVLQSASLECLLEGYLSVVPSCLKDIMTVELPTIPTQTTSNGSRAVTELAQYRC